MEVGQGPNWGCRAKRKKKEIRARKEGMKDERKGERKERRRRDTKMIKERRKRGK
jgi:hypothetical protein